MFKKSIKPAITCIIFTLIFTFSVYNICIDIWAIQFIYDLIGYILFSIFFFKKYKYNFFWSLFLLYTTVLIIDSTTYIFGSNLIPIRFPYASLFHLVGIVVGYFYVRKRKYFIPVFFAATVFAALSYFYFTPQILNYMSKKHKTVVNETMANFDNESYLTVNGDTVKIDYAAAKCNSLSFFFVGCGACVSKMKMYHKLTQQYSQKQYMVYEICNGTISSFEKFKKYVDKQDKNEGVKYLYDFNSVVENKKYITKYPLELIYNGNKYVESYEGFNDETLELSLKEHQNIINKINNEN